MISSIKQHLITSLVVAIWSVAGATANADGVCDWNATAGDIVVASKPPAAISYRTMAIVRSAETAGQRKGDEIVGPGRTGFGNHRRPVLKATDRDTGRTGAVDAHIKLANLARRDFEPESLLSEESNSLVEIRAAKNRLILEKRRDRGHPCVAKMQRPIATSACFRGAPDGLGEIPPV